VGGGSIKRCLLMRMGRICLDPSVGYTVDLDNARQVELAVSLLREDMDEAAKHDELWSFFHQEVRPELKEGDISACILDILGATDGED
jgi:hypothetical protein